MKNTVFSLTLRKIRVLSFSAIRRRAVLLSVTEQRPWVRYRAPSIKI